MVTPLQAYVAVFFVFVVAFAAGITWFSLESDAHSPSELRADASDE